MMSENQEKKLYVDEDWKSQVEAEREAAKQEQAEEPKEEAAAEQTPQDMPLPEPTLPELVTSLMTQAMYAMGLIPGPDGKPLDPRLNEAKHLVDMIAMLQEKTSGNRTDEESQMFDTLLHELHMAYLAVQQRSGK